MTLEQYAYLGEIFAALGVVASLIYVARQLGQNTAMTRVAAASEFLERDYEIVGPIIQSPELAEIWIKGETEFSTLGPANGRGCCSLSDVQSSSGITGSSYVVNDLGAVRTASVGG